MTRAKSLALAFYLGAALAGAAVGVAVDRSVFREPPRRDAGWYRNRFFDQLHLTTPQRDSATVILDERMKQLRAVTDRHKSALDPYKAEQDSVFTEGRRRLSRLLTPEQQAKMQRARRRMARSG